MAEQGERHVDELTGTETTGHEWDGLRELNQPLPRWWLWIFYATVIWGAVYWVLYPSWPLISSHTSGVLGWSSRGAVGDQLTELQSRRAANVEKLAATDITEIADDAELYDFTLAYGRAAFGDNCAPCHGAGGGGAPGYPNLIDDDWLWGGSIEDIQQTIAYGIRSTHDETRLGDMLAFGADEVLDRQEIATVVEFVRYRADLDYNEDADLEAGAVLFEENCVTCHGEDGTGNTDLGAANLVDAIWLHGSDRETIFETIYYGRSDAMPPWEDRLGTTTVKALATYVYSLGGGA